MHDLVHDLAEDIAGKEIKKQVEPSDRISSTDELMHVSVNIERPQWEFKAPATLLSARKIRSLDSLLSIPNCFSSVKESSLEMMSLEMMLLKFQSLRALNLKCMNISVVPNSIGKLRHLRYLNLAWNRRIKCLPDGITRLQNLQTLNLESCFGLKKLPRDFCELDNLRHLAIYETSLTEFPSGFGKMTSLIDLDYIIVGKNYGTYSLPPCPPMVRCIRVDSYEGVEMPRRWLDGLSNLVSICIMKCDECKVLPQLSQLSHLEDLTLEEIDGLEYVEDEDWVCGGDADGGGKCGSGAHNVYFPSLVELRLRRLRSLKGWTRPSNGDGGEPMHFLFPRLRNMTIYDCPKLMSMSLAPKLEHLYTEGINWKLLESNLTSIDDEDASSSSSTLLTSLKTLDIDHIDDGPSSLLISSRLSNLQRLNLVRCKKLASLTIESSDSIQYLRIRDCQSLKKVSLGNLSLLRDLNIWGCKEMTSLPQSLQGLTSLRRLDIRGCPNLKERYEKPNGQDCHLIQHIPNVKFDGI